MTFLELQVGSPLIVLVSGTLILMLAVSIKRSHIVASAITLLTLVFALAANQTAWNALPDAGFAFLTHMYVTDVQLFFNVLFILAAIITALFASSYLEDRIRRAEEFYILLLTATAGSIVVASASHFTTFILGLEIVSISLYAMIAYPQGLAKPLEASAKYLVLSAVASTSILFGMGLIYHATGAMAFDAIAAVEITDSRTYYQIGQGLIAVGIAFKLSLVPFHMWTPDVYQGAPAVVTGYVATVSKGAVIALLVRYADSTGALTADGVFYAVGAIAVLSMIVGNILALLQDNLKRLLAYSSIAHLGYLLIAVLVMSSTDSTIVPQTILLYVAAYFIITLAAFGIVSLTSDDKSVDNEMIVSYTGLFWRQPLLASIMTAVALSLAGIPLTIGFIAKFYVFAVGVEGAIWTFVWALLIGSAIGIYYYLRLIYTMTKPVEDATMETPPLAAPGLVALVVLGFLMVVLGVYPTPMLEMIESLVSQSVW